MTGHRKRRVAKRAVMGVAVVVLLAAWYVSAWIAASSAERTGYLSSASAWRLRPLFLPLLDYCESDRPGSGLLRRMWWSVNPPVISTGRLGHGGATFKMCVVLTLAPPRPAEVDEFIKAEFPPQGQPIAHSE